LRKSRKPIVIASRRSLLARRQAEIIGTALGRLSPHVTVQYRWIESQADQLTDAPLSDAGGKGLFVRAIERALLTERADIAVHSVKDLPAEENTQGLTIAAIWPRADVRDCLIAADGAGVIDDLPHGATVGTASPRRASQLLRIRPDLSIQLIRGNVETRLAKVMQDRECDATLLAVAGLHRANLHEHATHPIDLSLMLPAAGQGALAIQCRTDDPVTIRRCLPINDPITAAAVHAERRLVAALKGDCHSPIAVLGVPLGKNAVDGFRLRVKVLSCDGSRCLEGKKRSSGKGLDKTVKDMVADLIQRGVQMLLHDTVNVIESPVRVEVSSR